MVADIGNLVQSTVGVEYDRKADFLQAVARRRDGVGRVCGQPVVEAVQGRQNHASAPPVPYRQAATSIIPSVNRARKKRGSRLLLQVEIRVVLENQFSNVGLESVKNLAEGFGCLLDDTGKRDRIYHSP